MTSLIRDNCDFLKQGIDLLERHSNESYDSSDIHTFGSSIGSHMRHVLDHYSSFLSGLESGTINYDARSRGTSDDRILKSGIGRARNVLSQLQEAAIDPDQPVNVIVSANTLEDEGRSQSTLARELKFLASHTVHHYALIAIASRMQGILTPESFGVAPSTLKYMQTADC